MEKTFSKYYIRIRKKYLPRNKLYNIHEEKINKVTTEKWLRVIWYEGRYSKQQLFTLDNRRVVVITPGEWNFAPGPDFIGAIILLGDKRITGDIELHRKSSDWDNHKHNIDMRYNKVCLHIVLENDTGEHYVQRCDNYLIPQVELGKYFLSQQSASTDLINYPYSSSAGKGACGNSLTNERIPYLQYLVSSAGDARVILKSKRYTTDHSTEELYDAKREGRLEQLLYESICEGLGYYENMLSMSLLARLVPVNKLRKLFVNISDRILLLQAVLFGVAGLLIDNGTNRQYDIETKEYITKLYKYWKRYKDYFTTGEKFLWQFYKIRPLNYPTRRLAALSYIIDSFLSDSLVNKVLRWADILGNSDLNKLCSIFTQPVDRSDYFSYRAYFGSNKFKSAQPLLGSFRAMTIIVNTFLPFLYYYARWKNDKLLEIQLHRFYHHLRCFEQNRFTKLISHRLLVNKSNILPNNSCTQQGLLQLFFDFCDISPTQCECCPLPTILTTEKMPLTRRCKSYDF